MKVYAYMSDEDTTPGGRWVARIWHDKDTGWHPIIFMGLNEGSVRTQAQVWWDAELAKREAKAAPRKPKAETPPSVADPGDVL